MSLDYDERMDVDFGSEDGQIEDRTDIVESDDGGDDRSQRGCEGDERSMVLSEEEAVSFTLADIVVMVFASVLVLYCVILCRLLV
jgi:hypothetical protein